MQKVSSKSIVHRRDRSLPDRLTRLYFLKNGIFQWNTQIKRLNVCQVSITRMPSAEFCVGIKEIYVKELRRVYNLVKKMTYKHIKSQITIKDIFQGDARSYGDRRQFLISYAN